MPKKNSPVGVFDSGLGGLTVVHALKQTLPTESIIYFGDTARVPYGTKSEETVTRFSLQIAEFLIRRHVKLIVVACNTASAVALTSLRRKNTIPVIGVIEPAARAAVAATRSHHIGVIGTRATINSGAYTRMLRELDYDTRITSAACPLFVPLAEEGWTKGKIAEMVAEEYLTPFQSSDVDTLIPGCTHYPLLKKTIQSLLPDNVTLIDSPQAVAAEVASTLKNGNIASDAEADELRCFVSDMPQKFEELAHRFLGEPLGEVTLLQLD
ncbi:MAG: glutamate racemase [Candidatus Marinimicrobia bacterium]|jgi:glutamate racemase|nr:glutamate racemase [Candidatus Neomarinimicrobiota bacterium]MDP6592845.1 glutamate racemase [Candidatus Neomarinimicrobiota bacterium]MDP6835866.1 glutamate racemase [Candidatus Neomarinimicrobiota bacterium]|tara:strand:- start:180 stop:983 length:804 start_codon:yes stop_codon:yes gene_type:complete